MANCPYCGLPGGTCPCGRVGGSFGRLTDPDGFVPRRRTIPTKCSDCGARVFFHTNEYGSRVIFDELGPPWPKHECVPRMRRIARAPLGDPAVTRFDRAAVQNAEYERLLRSAWDKRSGRLWKPDMVTREAQMGDPEVFDIGVVHSVVPVLNFFKKLELRDDSLMAHAMLGVHLHSDWGQIEVDVDDLGSDDEPALRYHVLIDRDELARLALKKDDLVEFRIEPTRVSPAHSMWVCHYIERVE